MLKSLTRGARTIRHLGRAAGDPPVLVAQADRIGAVLGWRPRYNDLDLIVTHALNWERRLIERRSSTSPIHLAECESGSHYRSSRGRSVLAVSGTAGGCLIQFSTWAHLNH